MPIDERLRANQILRLAFGAPLAYLLASASGAPLPYIAASAYVTFAVVMPSRPAIAAVVALTTLVWIAPLVIGQLAGLLVQYSYLLVGMIGLILFIGFRLQSRPGTRPIGSVLVLLAVVIPAVQDLARDYAETIGGVLVLAVGQNVTIAIGTLLLAFAAFPGGIPQASAAPPPFVPEEATRLAAINAAVLVPLIGVLLAFDLTSSMRVLLVAATVLAASDPAGEKAQVESALAGLAIAGGIALGVSGLLTLWGSPAGGLLPIALAGLALGQRAIDPRHGAAVAAGLSTLWPLLGVGGDDPLGQTFWWLLLATTGVFYSIAVRRLFHSGPGGKTDALARRKRPIT